MTKRETTQLKNGQRVVNPNGQYIYKKILKFIISKQNSNKSKNKMSFYTRLTGMEENFDNYYWWWFRERITLMVMAGRNMRCYRFGEIHLPTSIKLKKNMYAFFYPVHGLCSTERNASVCKALCCSGKNLIRNNALVLYLLTYSIFHKVFKFLKNLYWSIVD